MKPIVFAMLCCLSLAACAGPADPQAGGQKVKVNGATAAPVAAAPAGSADAKVRAALKGLNPNISLDRVGAAPFPGFREVIANGQVFYVSDDGKYLMQGSVMDIAKREDVSEAAMSGIRKDVLAGLPMADRIVFPATGTEKHRIVVLTDIECGYCRKFHSELAEHNRRGVTVEYLAFPRQGLGSPDYHKMVSVWCSADRRKALTDAKNDRPVPAKTCRTPVDQQYRAGMRMGLTGTPMTLTEDGRMLGGYLTPDDLQKRLQAMDAAAKAGT